MDEKTMAILNNMLDKQTLALQAGIRVLECGGDRFDAQRCLDRAQTIGECMRSVLHAGMHTAATAQET